MTRGLLSRMFGNNKTAKVLAGGTLLTAVLCLTLKTDSLWTDEAFSAYIACHKNVASLWHTLNLGDSSDLQMWLYYTYLHLWGRLFGSSELALRSANVPFLCVFAMTIAWLRVNVFRSRWVWVAALLPYAWTYGGDTRPYMTLVALGTLFLTCLYVSLTDPRYSNSRPLAWLGLGALLIGLNFHMLMILAVAPAVTFTLFYRLTSGASLRLTRTPWSRVAIILSPLFLGYGAFLFWTFKRGTSYDYASPELLSMASVVYRFVGLGGFAPNRHYDIPFRPYIPGMALATFCLLVGIGMSIGPSIRARHPRSISLSLALVVGLCEALVLSFGFRQQIEVRHLAALSWLLPLLLFSAWEFGLSRGKSRIQFGMALIGCVWFISDVRATALPEYQREDFRDAVAQVKQLAIGDTSEIAVVADPAAVSYYELGMVGASPCFPLPDTCQQALTAVPWHRSILGEQATFWNEVKIRKWLQASAEHGKHRVLLISRSRHPMYSNSLWWKALTDSTPSRIREFHGFAVFTFGDEKY